MIKTLIRQHTLGKLQKRLAPLQNNNHPIRPKRVCLSRIRNHSHCCVLKAIRAFAPPEGITCKMASMAKVRQQQGPPTERLSHPWIPKELSAVNLVSTVETSDRVQHHVAFEVRLLWKVVGPCQRRSLQGSQTGCRIKAHPTHRHSKCFHDKGIVVTGNYSGEVFDVEELELFVSQEGSSEDCRRRCKNAKKYST